MGRGEDPAYPYHFMPFEFIALTAWRLIERIASGIDSTARCNINLLLSIVFTAAKYGNKKKNSRRHREVVANKFLKKEITLRIGVCSPSQLCAFASSLLEGKAVQQHVLCTPYYDLEA